MQFPERHGLFHWRGLLKLLGYVCSTKEHKLDPSKIKEPVLTVYSDADRFFYGYNQDAKNGDIILFLSRLSDMNFCALFCSEQFNYSIKKNQTEQNFKKYTMFNCNLKSSI